MNQKDEFRKYATDTWHFQLPTGQLCLGLRGIYISYGDRRTPDECRTNGRVLTPYDGSHHISGHGNKRLCGKYHTRTIAFPLVGGFDKGYQYLYQFTWRGRLCWFGHLRYHAVYFAQCGYDMYRYGRVDGGSTDVGRGKRQAVGAETFADHDTPASWRGGRARLPISR